MNADKDLDNLVDYIGHTFSIYDDSIIRFMLETREETNGKESEYEEFVEPMCELLKELPAFRDRLKDLLARHIILKNKIHRVELGVIGDFSSGKSSFINSILGESLCPTNLAAATKTITKFIYGDEKEIRDAYSDEVYSDDEYKASASHQGGKKAAKLFEYSYPSSILKNISLYDTPGFSNAQNSEDTLSTLEQVAGLDAVFLVVDINKGDISASLMEKIEQIRQTQPRLIWHVILNKADTKPPSARQKVAEHILCNYAFVQSCTPYASVSTKFDQSLPKSEILKIIQDIGSKKTQIAKDVLNKDKSECLDELEKILGEIGLYFSRLAEEADDDGGFFVYIIDKIQNLHKRLLNEKFKG